MTVKKLRRVRATIVAVEKSISITYSECLFVVLGIQRAVRRIISSVWLYNIFFTLSHKRHDFRKKKKRL
jgi:hypothetical protein